MPEQVKVDDFEVFRLFRVALLKFAQAAGQALANADGQIARTHSWLEGEQSAYWQGQLRRRSEAFVKAREALRQKKLFKDSSGRTPDAALEEKAVNQCRAAVEEAQQKIEAVRKALPKLEKEAELYRGAVSRLSGTVSVEVPRAIALLDRLAVNLEEYVQIKAPDMNLPETADTAPAEDSMSRGGDADTELPAKPPESTPAAGQAAAAPADLTETPPPAQTPPEKERRDVADGK